MTVSSELSRVQYAGNGEAVSFPFDFRVFAGSDVKAVATAPGGAERVLEEGVDYSVSLAAEGEGGLVSYPLSGQPLAFGHKLTLMRSLPFTQEVDLLNQGAWLPEVLEGALDRVTLLAQELKEAQARSLSLPPGSGPVNATVPAPTGASLLGFNASGALSLYSLGVTGVDLGADLGGSGPGKGSALVGWEGREGENVTAALGKVVLYESDPTPGYLSEKLQAGDNVSLTENGGALTLSVPEASRVLASPEDLVPGTLWEKLTGDGGLSFSLTGGAGGQALKVSLKPPRGHLHGLSLTLTGSAPRFSVSIAPGEAADETGETALRLENALVKRIDGFWAAGDGMGGREAGSALSSGSWWHVWLIGKADGQVDALLSPSATAPYAQGGYAFKRRVGSLYYQDNVNGLKPFIQRGAYFTFATPVLSHENLAVHATEAGRALMVPQVPGEITAHLNLVLHNLTGSQYPYGLVSSPLAAHDAPGPQAYNVRELKTVTIEVDQYTSLTRFEIPTDNSIVNVQWSASSSDEYSLVTLGWRDGRGRG